MFLFKLFEKTEKQAPAEVKQPDIDYMTVDEAHEYWYKFVTWTYDYDSPDCNKDWYRAHIEDNLEYKPVTITIDMVESLLQRVIDGEVSINHILVWAQTVSDYTFLESYFDIEETDNDFLSNLIDEVEDYAGDRHKVFTIEKAQQLLEKIKSYRASQ